MKKIMLLGSGELGKEFVISAKRMGFFVISVDSYLNAPAHQISDIKEVCNMNDQKELKLVIEKYNPDYIVPEIEAISTELLLELEREGVKIVPSAKAVNLTMNRDRIRNYVVENCPDVKTARFNYADNLEDFLEKTKNYKKFVVKPCMSSSGKGQSIVNPGDDLKKVWEYAMDGMRGVRKKVIIEEFIDFEYEITMLTILSIDGSVSFCKPILHFQKDGDYKWSSHNHGQDFLMSKECENQLKKQSEYVVKAINTTETKSAGLFGVEFFICKNKETNELYPIFSELSPRPHDTGMVTMISQKINQFDLHLRAIMGINIPSNIENNGGVSVTINGTKNQKYQIPEEKIKQSLNDFFDSEIRIFGKEDEKPGRRMGVILSSNLETGLKIKKMLSD